MTDGEVLPVKFVITPGTTHDVQAVSNITDALQRDMTSSGQPTPMGRSITGL